jgi:hypothetical protein
MLSIVAIVSAFLIFPAVNARVVTAQTFKNHPSLSLTGTVLPSGTLTRHVNNPIIPMGPAGSLDDDKTGPRVVIKESATSYKMWYEAVPAPNASTVGYATSTDGKSWTKQGSVLSPSAPWEGGVNGEISPNTILIEGGVYKMWYHSFGPDGKRRIGYATSPNGLSWTKNPAPVLDVGADGAFDDYMVTEPRVFKLENGSYRMYYGGMRNSERGQYRLMTANSSDGVTWTRTNQVLFGPSLGAGFGIVKDDAQWHMWYDQNFSTLNYASSPDGIVWTPGPNNPVLTLNPNPAASDSGGVGDSVSAYRDGSEFRVMYTGGRYNSFGRNESICLATITAPVCSYSINPVSQSFAVNGGTGSAGVTTMNGCIWTAQTNDSWITIKSGNGSGNGSVSFTVQSNTGPARTGIITVGGQNFTINQAGNFRNIFDFDGDNKSDISIFRALSGEWWINQSSTNQTTAARFGTATDKITPADFTGDGRTDTAFWRGSTGEWFILRSEDNSFLSFPFGSSGDVPVVGDFEADGRADPSVYRPSTNEWFILKSSGGTIIMTFGISGDVPVVADYDGDRKSDIAVFRPGNGSWWYLRSTDSQFRVFSFGVSTDKPVQGDYSGDGKADIAVYRPLSGEWLFQRSEDNSYYSVPFGASGDIPAPGDYDGDGRFDTAVFRPSSATWFVQSATAGISIVQFGTAGDTPVPSAFVP